MDKLDIQYLIYDIQLDYEAAKCRFDNASGSNNKIAVDLAVYDMECAENKLKLLRGALG